MSNVCNYSIDYDWIRSRQDYSSISIQKIRLGKHRVVMCLVSVMNYGYYSDVKYINENKDNVTNYTGSIIRVISDWFYNEGIEVISSAHSKLLNRLIIRYIDDKSMVINKCLISKILRVINHVSISNSDVSTELLASSSLYMLLAFDKDYVTIVNHSIASDKWSNSIVSRGVLHKESEDKEIGIKGCSIKVRTI